MFWRVSAAALLSLACEPVECGAGSTAPVSCLHLPAGTDPAPPADPAGVALQLESTSGSTGAIADESPAIDPAGGPVVREPEAGRDADETADDTADDTAEGDDTAADKHEAWIVHEVVPEESIAQLALRYRVDPGKIRGWNGLGRGARVRPGQRLRLLTRRTPPPRERVRYTVREGDTWTSIAREHGADPGAVRAYNIKRTGRRLYPGLELDVWRDPLLAGAATADKPPSGPAAEIRPGGFSVGRPSDGRLVNGVQIPESADYDRRYPGSAWGTSFAVRHLVDTLHRWREQSGYAGLLRLGAMSRQRGRPIGGHRSHQSGRDLDIRLPLREGLADEMEPTPRRADWVAVYALVRAFADSGAVTQIFLDYRLQSRLYKVAKAAGADRQTLRRLIQFPRGSGARRGLLRHSPGHDIHLHVRFACADYESECAGR
ncbi:MAG: penicillin-insensitive murein endopeptidase [Nannocystis sp.]|nr:penicillin-insensitive murein endopeptidase [Nannocystis sp.]MBA3547734.1 penicillin-insensitive murein endopeptidase [Nannocystis sp.]